MPSVMERIEDLERNLKNLREAFEMRDKSAQTDLNQLANILGVPLLSNVPIDSPATEYSNPNTLRSAGSKY